MWPFGRRLQLPGPMRLRLRDLTFPIQSATLSGRLVDPHWASKYDPTNPVRLTWSLTIQCESRQHLGDVWAPLIAHDTLQPTLARWTDWPGQVFAWSRPFDKTTGKPNGSFYVFEHADIPRGRLEFLSRAGLDFEIAWTGACDIRRSWKYGTSVPFALRATVRFTNILVRGSEHDTDATIRARLAQQLNLDGLHQRPLQLSGHRYEDGVAMAAAEFEALRNVPNPT